MVWTNCAPVSARTSLQYLCFARQPRERNGFLHIARVEKHSDRSCFRTHEPNQTSTVVFESGSVRCADFQGLSMTHVLQDIHSDTRESVHRCPETCILLVVQVPNPESDMLPPRSRSNRFIPFRARQNCSKWHQHLSNKQSKASLWLRETCLIVALLPLMIIFITASLSSCTTEHHGERVLRSGRRKPPLSNVGGSNFMRILGMLLTL